MKLNLIEPNNSNGPKSLAYFPKGTIVRCVHGDLAGTTIYLVTSGEDGWEVVSLTGIDAGEMYATACGDRFIEVTQFRQQFR